MGDLGERVVLVHELAELRGAEELLHGGRHRLRVDHLLRHQRLALGEVEPLLDRTLDAHEADPERVLGHLADRTDTAVAEVIDVIDDTVAVADGDQDLQDLEHIVLGEDIRTDDLLAADAPVELHAADIGEVVALGVEEEVVEEVLGSVAGRRLTGSHHAVDLHQRLEAVAGGIDAERVGDVRTSIEIVHIQRVDIVDAGFDHLLGRNRRDDLVGRGDDLASLGVDHIVRENLAVDVVTRDGELAHACVLELPDMARRDTTAFLDDHLVADADLEGSGLTAQAGGHELEGDLVLGDEEGVLVEEHIQHLGVSHAKGAQDHRHRQLAAAVDAREHVVLRIELKVEPGTTVGDDAGIEQQLARGVRLATVVIEEHAGAAVQLRDDDALGAVHHESTVVGHQRQFAEIDLLFTDILDGFVRTRGFLVVHHETHLHAQRRRVGEAAQLALLHVEARLAKAVGDVLQTRIARVAGDRENALEGRMQTHVRARFLGLVLLEELAVGIELDGEQVRRLEDAALLAVVLADALLRGEGVSHQTPLSSERHGDSEATGVCRPRLHRSPCYVRNAHRCIGGIT